ncbi:hypothetical protein [Amycolatopsis samaneae]|uniref:Helix-turn-helix domain-containing protein n=1 Tax=Amycolatopsis samaneae TaxID=664691 RepID=A0ABW5GKJ3_9PSEU
MGSTQRAVKIVDGPPSGPNTTCRYLDMGEIATWFGVAPNTVASWRTRYLDTHPFPEPDVLVGRNPGNPGWAASRKDEIEAWEKARPGQGAGGGRPRKTRP